MITMNLASAPKNVTALVDEVQVMHEPMMIVGEKNSMVLLSEENWRAIEETLYLSAIPGMRESILQGLREDPTTCATTVEWE